jgi:hypothetical protein
MSAKREQARYQKSFLRIETHCAEVAGWRSLQINPTGAQPSRLLTIASEDACAPVNLFDDG